MISIYKENPKYSLALRKDGDAAVVVIVDSRGDLVDSPYLLRIGHTGLLRYSGANCEALEYLGIPTDAVDSIKISPDDYASEEHIANSMTEDEDDQEEEW